MEEIKLPEISTPVGLLYFIPLFINLRYQQIVERLRTISRLILDRDMARLSFNLEVGIQGSPFDSGGSWGIRDFILCIRLKDLEMEKLVVVLLISGKPPPSRKPPARRRCWLSKRAGRVFFNFILVFIPCALNNASIFMTFHTTCILGTPVD